MIGGAILLTDENNNVYEFPGTFWIDSGSIPNNANILNSFYAPGGKNIADGFFQSRIISLTGELRGDTQDEYETEKRAFFQACLKGGRLEINNDNVPRYIDVKIPDFEHEQEQGQLFTRITVTFQAEFPLWVDSVENESEHILTGNASFQVNNTGSDFLVLPRFQFEATDTGGLPSVILSNRSDGAGSFEYTDPQFQSGDILIIDSSEGTVKLNNDNRIRNFRPANFLRLQPGINIFVYQGGACSLTIFWRKVYIL